MGHRVIEGLVWAEIADRPPALPRRRPRGAKAAGLRYERALAKAIPGATHGQWLRFCDKNGPGWCQPDLLLDDGPVLYVLECKLTDVAQARSQIAYLYRPVLEYIWAKPVRGIIVVRHLTRASPIERVCDTLAKAKTLAQQATPLLHWLGTGFI